MDSDSSVAVQRMKELFKKCDKDGDGTISKSGLASILRKICKGANAGNIADMVNAADKNRNQVIEFSEFVECLFLSGPASDVPKLKRVSQEACLALWTVWRAVVTKCNLRGSNLAEITVSRDELVKALEGERVFIIDALKPLGDEGHQGVLNNRMAQRLQAPDTLANLRSAPEMLQQEDFVSAVWEKLEPAEKNAANQLMKRFDAQEKLSRVVLTVIKGMPLTVNTEQLRCMFDEVDADGNGLLSVKELVQVGSIDLEQAMAFHERLDAQKDGMIDFKDLMQVVSLGCDVKQGLKGMFAASLEAE